MKRFRENSSIRKAKKVKSSQAEEDSVLMSKRTLRKRIWKRSSEDE